MTVNISYLFDFKEINGGYVAFGGNPKGGKITGKGKIKIGKLDFDDVYFVKELKFNLVSILQMCDKKNNVLFTDTECVVFSSDFKLPDENHMLLRVLRENNMYNVDLKNIVPSGDLTCLFAKATLDESNLWHRRLGHINFKTMNKLVKSNLVRGLLSKVFENSHTRVACKKGKQHRASCKTTWSGLTWLFDIDTLTQSMNYQPVIAGNQPNSSVGIQGNFDVVVKEAESAQQYVLIPLWSTGSKDPQNTDADAAFDDTENESEVHVSLSSSDKPKKHDEKAKREAKGKSPVELYIVVKDLSDEFEEFSVNSTNRVNAASALVTVVDPNSTNNINNFNAAGPSDNAVSSNFEIGGKSLFMDPSQYPDDPNMLALEDIVYSDDEEDVGAKADFYNLETSITVSPIPTTRVHKDHTVTQIIGYLSSAPQTRSMTRVEEGIYYEEVFALVARIKAIRLFLAYASFVGFMVYQMDVKSAFLYGSIEEEVYVGQPLGFEDPNYPDKVYKVVKALYELHQAPRACQDKYVAKILRKIGLIDGKLASTPIDTEKPLLKDPDGKDVDVHIYRHFLNDVSSKLMQFGLTIDAAHLMLLSHKIVDFLNAHMIQYALMVNPTIYVSCIKKFWTFVSIKKSNDVVKLQALIDRKNVIITDDTIRQAIRLDATAGCMSAKRTAWNEFSSFMALAVICLATGRKFNFSKYIFDSMAVEDAAEDEDNDNETCATLTKQAANLEQDKIAQTIEITKLKQRVRRLEKKRQFKYLGLKRLRKVGTSERVESLADTVMDDKEDASKQRGGIDELDADEDVTLVDAEEDMNTNVQGRLAKSQAKVVTTVATIITAAQVLKASAPWRRRGVVIQDLEETATASVIVHTNVKSKDKCKGILIEEPKPLKRQAQIEQDEAFARQSKAKLNANINWDDVMEQLKRIGKQDNTVMRYQALKIKPMTEAQVRKNMMIYLKNMAGFKIHFFKGMTYNDIRPIFEKNYNLNQAFLERVEEEVIGQKEKGSKRKGNSLNQDAAKKQRINEDEEELKAHLQIVVNDDDDVFTEATPFSSKVPVVEYQNNKPYYKITKADGTHKLFISFITSLKNFDKEDLEMLWKLVQERF
uniref:Putative ribonuclease H-like domain-containing protein n=1 Tax=Tanacetum cinerariifolium TaxID=118510 RepID=A0A6L2JQR9_TANCI|nr:putative ribonuclease H-like domain-containing protein [Tanacetum cinerariifolium]